MTVETDLWNVVAEGLAFRNSVLSVQRYPLPSNRILREAPSSCGVLQVAKDGDRFLVGVPETEAFWIGIVVREPLTPAFSVVGRSPQGGRYQLCRCDRAGIIVLPGFLRPNGYLAFALETIVELAIVLVWEVARISFVTVQEFVARTHQPPPSPLDPHAAYQGWKLP